jgi:flagellar hook assembly protein FlgD
MGNNNNSSNSSNNNNSNIRAQIDIGYVITNPQELWAARIQRVNHSDHVEDKGEDLLALGKLATTIVVTPKF